MVNNTVKTTKITGNKEYALVPDRLQAFRSKHPRALVETKPTITENYVVFEARIVKDKSKADSAESYGHSYGTLKDAKAFEKLETIAVGRALANLGYLNNGQIASTEEMEEFEEYQIAQFIEKINMATTRQEFQDILNTVNPSQKQELTPLIAARIAALKEANNE